MKAYVVLSALLGASAVAGLGCGGGEPMNVVTAHDAGKGTVAIYDASADQVWTAAHAALKWSDVGKPEDHQDKWYVITDPAAADQVGIWLSPEGAKTRVKVVVMDDPGLPGPYESEVVKYIGQALDLMAQGKPIDKKP